MITSIRTATFTLTAVLCCTTALRAEITTGSIADSLGAAGFTATEIHFGSATVHAEATNGTQRIEVVYDRATGQVLSQEVSGAGSDDRADAGVRGGTDDPADHDQGDDHGSNGSGSDDSGSDDHGGGSDDSGSDDHGGGSDDSGSDDHGSGSDDSGSDDHGGGSDDSGSDDHGGGSDDSGSDD